MMGSYTMDRKTMQELFAEAGAGNIMKNDFNMVTFTDFSATITKSK